jgi:hypothetical protein
MNWTRLRHPVPAGCRIAAGALLCAALGAGPALGQEKLTEHTVSRSPGASGPCAQVEDITFAYTRVPLAGEASGPR